MFEILFYFCRRGRENMRDLKVSDFEVASDEIGRRYVREKTSEQTKNHTGITNESEGDGARMYATGTKMCLRQYNVNNVVFHGHSAQDVTMKGTLPFLFMIAQHGYGPRKRVLSIPTPNTCVCSGTFEDVPLPGQPITVITTTGRYDVFMPVYSCTSCQETATYDMHQLFGCGYWIGTPVRPSTIYDIQLFRLWNDIVAVSPDFPASRLKTVLERVGRNHGRLNIRLRKNSIGQFMVKLSKEAELSDTYTNHCVCATTITVLNNVGFKDRDIVSVSRHRNEKSLASYVADTRVDTKRNMSDALSTITNNLNAVVPVKPTSTCSHSPVNPCAKPSVIQDESCIDLLDCDDSVLFDALSEIDNRNKVNEVSLHTQNQQIQNSMSAPYFNFNNCIVNMYNK
ncbi:PREDICTED: uncharacterized protein LOC106812703 [Priapulus caudatus]|uniref:Uncharacterized protein LOC106812703 n=1 Tax=Priapulus caudatus TaxID=37621 RepID=A0ABM1EIW1_PRICU|nr:PREDICTED: uncharacterized protein LOC106812703 [Priapulus caudatus]